MNDGSKRVKAVGDNGDGLFSAEEWEETLHALKLTAQQRRVVTLLIEGHGDAYIAWKLSIKVSTLRTHFNRIFELLDVHDRVSVVRRIFAEFRRGCGNCPRSRRTTCKR